MKDAIAQNESEIKKLARLLGARGGARATEAQKAAARENGKRGGRPVEWVHGRIEVGRELSYTLPGGARVNLGKILDLRFAGHSVSRMVAVCERGERGYGKGKAQVYTR